MRDKTVQPFFQTHLTYGNDSIMDFAGICLHQLSTKGYAIYI